MFSLEHLPHATGPDFFHQDVVAQRQGFAIALRDLFGLKLRQFPLTNEFKGQFLRILWLTLGRQEVLERIASDNAAVFKLFDEVFEGQGHV